MQYEIMYVKIVICLSIVSLMLTSTIILCVGVTSRLKTRNVEGRKLVFLGVYGPEKLRSLPETFQNLTRKVSPIYLRRRLCLFAPACS